MGVMLQPSSETIRSYEDYISLEDIWLKGEIRLTDLIRFMLEAFVGSSRPCVQIMPSLEMVFVSPSGSGAQLGGEKTGIIRTGSSTLSDGRLLFFLIRGFRYVSGNPTFKSMSTEDKRVF